jgi:hypothetical protein
MNHWKIVVSIAIGIVISIILLNTVTGNVILNYSYNITPIDASIFYKGIAIIVLAIILLCAVIIYCTDCIVKAINNKK